MIKLEKINHKYLILLGCVLISLILYYHVINAFLSSDDFAWIYQIKTKGAFHLWMSEPHIYFRPITSLTFFLDYTIWGLNPIGYHLTSLLFHSLCAFQLYITTSLLLNRVKLQANHIKIASLLATFIFLILPSHAEAVSWISARSDLIVTFFCLTAFNFYLAYKKTHLKIYFVLSYFLFLCALLSKETAIIYPGFIFIYEIYDTLSLKTDQQISWVNRLLRLCYFPAFYATLFPIYFLIRYLRIHRFIGGQGASVHLDFSGEIIWRGLGRSLRTILPPMPGTSEQLWQILFCIFAASLVGFCLFLWRIGKPYQKITQLIILLLALYLLTLLPMINLWLSVTTYENERLLYLPSTFICILLALILGSLYLNYKFIFFLILTLSTLFWSIHLYSSSIRWQTVGQISRQILEDIKSAQIEVGRTIFVNLPDNLNGSYIYMSSFDEAIQLFDQTQKNQEPHVLLYQSLTASQNSTEILKYAPNQYYVQLKDVGTSFINRYRFPLEKEFETNHYQVKNLEEKGYSTYDIEFKTSEFKHLAYYSNQKLMIKELSLKTSPITAITNPRWVEDEMGLIDGSQVDLNPNNFPSISGKIATPKIVKSPLIFNATQDIKLEDGVINLPKKLEKEPQKLTIFLAYGDLKLIVARGEFYPKENTTKSSLDSNSKTLKWKATFPAKVLPWFGTTDIKALLFIPETKQFFAVPGTVSVRVIPKEIAQNADFVKNPSEIYGYIDENYNVSNSSLIKNNHPTRLTVEGWARLPDQKQQPEKVFLSFNGEPSFFATADINIESPSVAETFNSNLYSHARWSTSFSTQFLPLGKTAITAWVYDSVKNKFFKLSNDLNVRVFPENLTLQRETNQVYGYVDDQPTDQPLMISGNENLTVDGWAILPNSLQQPEQVYLSYGDEPVFFTTANVNLESQDVAQTLNSQKYSYSRWKAQFSTQSLPLGETVINAWIYHPEQQKLLQLKDEIKVIKPSEIGSS
jgi:hypothetical protein